MPNNLRQTTVTTSLYPILWSAVSSGHRSHQGHAIGRTYAYILSDWQVFCLTVYVWWPGLAVKQTSWKAQNARHLWQRRPFSRACSVKKKVITTRYYWDAGHTSLCCQLFTGISSPKFNVKRSNRTVWWQAEILTSKLSFLLYELFSNLFAVRIITW